MNDRHRLARVAFVLPDDALDEIVQLAAERAAALLAMPSTEPEFLTPSEAAELLRCDRQRVYELLSAGRLRRYKDGGRVLIRRADIYAHLGVDDSVAARRRAA